MACHEHFALCVRSWTLNRALTFLQQLSFSEIRKDDDCMSMFFDTFVASLWFLMVDVMFFPLFPTNASPRDDDVVLVESDAEITGVTPSVLCLGVVDAGPATAAVAINS